MSIRSKCLLITALCLFWAGYASGQAARTPFSSFGIGEYYGTSLINHQGMAGVGVSQPQFEYIGSQNPALLVYNSLYTTFHAGIVTERRSIKSDTLTETAQGGNMNYLVTAFPIKPGYWTTSVGLMPYTSVNYRLQYTDNVANSTDQVTVTEEGDGGLTQLYWSNGVRLTRRLAVGVRAAYIFSSIIHTYKNQLIDARQPVNYIVAVEEKSYVRDFTFGTGIVYSKDSLFKNNRYRLSIGATYDFATKLDVEKTDRLLRTNQIGDTTDVQILPSSRDGSYQIPWSLTTGISLSRGMLWSVGLQFSLQDWTQYRNVYGQSENLQRSWRAAIGGEITPDPFSEKFLNRTTYRAGLSMEESPFLASNNPVRDVGINFGFSLPAGRANSLDMAFRYGRRGNIADNTLREDYFKIYFGLTFNDQWFIKRRYD
jgi:hypothetical protein